MKNKKESNTYSVYYTGTFSGEVEIEANTKTEARLIAHDMFYGGNGLSFDNVDLDQIKFKNIIKWDK